jgi:hypothetical protein
VAGALYSGDKGTRDSRRMARPLYLLPGWTPGLDANHVPQDGDGIRVESYAGTR